MSGVSILTGFLQICLAIVLGKLIYEIIKSARGAKKGILGCSCGEGFDVKIVNKNGSATVECMKCHYITEPANGIDRAINRWNYHMCNQGEE